VRHTAYEAVGKLKHAATKTVVRGEEINEV
jgi:hypothetical protein